MTHFCGDTAYGSAEILSWLVEERKPRPISRYSTSPRATMAPSRAKTPV